MSPAISVVVPTWRLGGFDVVLPALEAQSFRDFEVVVADMLWRWRSPAVAERLAGLPFPVKHVPVDNDIFPVASPFRVRNSGIRASEGERVVFILDYGLPPTDFLERHAELPSDTIGLSSYKLYRVPPVAWALPEMADKWVPGDTWRVVEEAIRGNCLWSAFSGWLPNLDDCDVRDRQPCGLLDPSWVPPPGRLDIHWRSDSVPREALVRVNGLDEAFDGHDWGDVDLTARLVADSFCGFHRVDAELPVLDPHPVLYCPIINNAQDNKPKLDHSIASRRARCRHGLTYDDSVPLIQVVS